MTHDFADNIKFVTKYGFERIVTVEMFSRGGSMSPTLHIVHHQGRRITPYELGKMGWRWDFNGLFLCQFGTRKLLEVIRQEAGKPNYFLQKVKRDDTWNGGHFVMPAPRVIKEVP